jgi:hypothetical protein
MVNAIMRSGNRNAGGGDLHLAGNTLSIFRIIRSAHCTAEATIDSVRGLGLESDNSSVVFR